MPARLRYRPAFNRDVIDRVEWLAENKPESWLRNFEAALTHVEDELRRHPRIGAVVKEDAPVVLRLWSFPGDLPYVVLYAHRRREPVAELVLVRLFRQGQDRPAFRLSDWPW